MVDYERHNEIYIKKNENTKKSLYGVQTTPRKRHKEKKMIIYVVSYIFSLMALLTRLIMAIAVTD